MSNKYLCFFAVIISIVIGLFLIFGEVTLSLFERVEIMIGVMTIIVILLYGYDTREIAKTSIIQANEAQEQTKYTQKQLEFLEGCNLFIGLGEIYIPMTEIPIVPAQLRSTIYIKTTSKFNLEAFICIVFRFYHNDKREVIKTIGSSLYGGKQKWNIPAEQNFQGNFGLTGFILNDIEFDSKDDYKLKKFIESMKDGTLQGRLEIAVFSKLRPYGKSDESFRKNQPVYYYLTYKKEKNSNIGRFVWILEPMPPPKIMEDKAFTD